VKKPAATFQKKKQASQELFFYSVEDKKGCPRYTGRILEGVSVVAVSAEAEKSFVSWNSRHSTSSTPRITFFLNAASPHAFTSIIEGAHCRAAFEKAKIFWPSTASSTLWTARR